MKEQLPSDRKSGPSFAVVRSTSRIARLKTKLLPRQFRFFPLASYNSLWEGEAPAEPTREWSRRLGGSLALPRSNWKASWPLAVLPGHTDVPPSVAHPWPLTNAFRSRSSAFHRPRAGRHDWPAEARPHRRNLVPKNFLRARAQQFSSLLFRPAHLFHRHLDDDDRARLARLSTDRIESPPRGGGRGRFRADAFSLPPGAAGWPIVIRSVPSSL